MQAIIVADGDVAGREAIDRTWPGWALPDALVIAVDGGARHAARLGLDPAVWVGDADSIDAADLDALAARGVELHRSSTAKDESDTELALHLALERGASDIVILGALGGPRIDHALANIGLLALARLADRPAVLLDAGSRIALVRAPGPDGSPVRRSLAGRVDDLVSLLPLGSMVEGITTSGLAYPLADEDLAIGPARGLSNVRVHADAAVTVRSGRLLVIESPATLRT